MKAPHGTECICFQNGDEDWTSRRDINDWISENFGTVTLNRNFLCYNDEEPRENHGTTSKGHSKGILAWSDTEIIWMIHSVPRWPHISDSFEEEAGQVEREDASGVKGPEGPEGPEGPNDAWFSMPQCFSCCPVFSFFGSSVETKKAFNRIPKSQLIYAQSFAIVTTEFSRELQTNIFHSLQNMQVHVYQSSGFSLHVFPSVALSDQLFAIQLEPNVLHLGKSPELEKDFYAEGVVPYLKSNRCLVESWMRPAMEECDVVKHAKRIKWKRRTCTSGRRNNMVAELEDTAAATTAISTEHTEAPWIKYSEGSDHSKWAISLHDYEDHRKKKYTNQNDRKWVLVGDMNRMKSQAHRGGGGVVFFDEKLWKLFYEIAED